jgi:hypothetical protein
MCKHSIITIKPGHQTTENTHVIWSDESSILPAVPYIRNSLHLKTPKEAYNSECLVPKVKHKGGSVVVWAAISWNSVGAIITLHGLITARKYVDRLHNQVHPMISKQRCSFRR